MSSSNRRTFLKTATAAGVASVVLPTRGAWAGFQATTAKVATPDPIPASEQQLRQIKAEPWLQVDKGNVFLKGTAFDRSGNLTVIAAYATGADTSLAARRDRAILRISPDKQVSTIIRKQGPRFCDHAIHKDGRIFIACLTGELFVVNPDGTGFRQIEVKADGKPEELSDLTFDRNGALYVTDFTGKPGNPLGGVYRYAPDFSSVELFGPHLVSPNGVAFTGDEDAMWVTCSFDKKLMKLTLNPDRKSVTSAVSTYELSGPGGDGVRVDRKGNVYVSMNFQGRFLVFNPEGKPIATVLMPNRENGALLGSTNLVFKPGTDEVYCVAAGDVGGTWIYRFRGLAEGLPLYSHA